MSVNAQLLVVGIILTSTTPPLSACQAQLSSSRSLAGPEQTPLNVEDVYGLWRVTADDSECLLSLSAQGEEGHYEIFLEQPCPSSLFAKATAWRIDGQYFQLLDSNQAMTLRFRMTGLDSFESEDGLVKGRRAALR